MNSQCLFHKRHYDFVLFCFFAFGDNAQNKTRVYKFTMNKYCGVRGSVVVIVTLKEKMSPYIHTGCR